MQSLQSTSPKNNYFLIAIYLLTIAPTLYSMNMVTTLRLLLQKQPNDAEMTESFVREFPLMTLKNAKYRYTNCSASAQKKISAHFYDDENKQISALFMLTTQYPEDIRKKIVASMFCHNEKAAYKFLHLPVRDFYNLYQWAHDVYEGEAGIPSTFNIRSINHIFELSDEIKRAEVIILSNRKNDNICLGKKDINILRTIIENSRTKENVFIDEQFKYRFYLKYTKNDFKQLLVLTAAISGCLYVPLITAFLSRLIESYCCAKIMIDSSLPNKIKQLTELIYQNGNLSLLDALRKPQDNIAYSWIDLFKKNIPFLITIPGIGFLGSLPQLNSKDFLFFSGIHGTLFSVFCCLCSWVPFEKFPGGFLGLFGAIPISLFIGLNVIDVKYKYPWQSQTIDWDAIDKELQNDCIFLPEESKIL